ncbi:hypothetical protein [Petrachloros mirabilis]
MWWKPRSITNLPTTARGLRAWLRDTDEGRRIVTESYSEALETKCRLCEIGCPFPKVLVVLRRLGNYAGAEIYAEKGCLIKTLEMPDVPEEWPMAEEWIEVNLPKHWRHMVALPAKRIESEVFRGLHVFEAACYEEQARWLDELRNG